MNDIIGPPAGGVKTPPETCREYLGETRGYCRNAPQIADTSGRKFCPEHAQERWL